MNSGTIRTPDDRFEGLPGFAFAPNYCTLADGLRVHYVDEGPKDAPVVLLMHGEPTWSYLYRHMIPLLVKAGLRAVAPDLVGFGRSDKLVSRGSYSYANHVGWMRQWLEQLDLNDMTLVCQDWGSLIGLRLAAEVPERFGRIVLANGGLPEGQRFSRAFDLWRAFSRWSPIFPIGRIVAAGTRRKLSAAEIAAYDAPFNEAGAKAGARIFPSLVPVTPDDPALPDQHRAWRIFEQWSKPFLCCFSDGDPITRGGDQTFLDRVPGTAGQKHRTLKGGHFIQEDDPAGFVAAIVDVLKA